MIGGGETGIRTLGTVARTVVFETTPFDHSGISPHYFAITLNHAKVGRVLPLCLQERGG